MMTKKELFTRAARGYITRWQAARQWLWQKSLQEKTLLTKDRLPYWEGLGIKFFEKITNEKIHKCECEVIRRWFPYAYRGGKFISRQTEEIRLCYTTATGKKLKIDIPMCSPCRAHIYDF